jgi:glycosidase
MVKYLQQIIAITLSALALAACSVQPVQPAATSGSAINKYLPQPYIKFQHADWTKNATIYQINTRQFTPEGTFRAAEKELPRLKDLGADILWLMPIHPIGEVNRKGSMGSPYAVKDYFAVNPEFGSMEDFKHFVDAAHKLGFHIILDWVGNHTAWDNVIRKDHEDWYEKDYKGKVHPTPWFDWDDIIDLDYSKPALREYMTSAMIFWVKNIGVDGYRADAAGFVPLDFWENVTAELRKIKPVFMLAEWESRDMHALAFDASYSWTWWDNMQNIAKGRADATSLFGYYAWNEKFYPKDAYRMLYATNHDKNAWEGTEYEIFGDAVESVVVLSVISEGIPLIYNGQEAGNKTRLKFFERDSIKWQPSPYYDLYKKLFALKKSNTALWNGHWGATMIQVPNNLPKEIFSFVRQNENDKVFAVFNLSNKSQKVKFKDTLYQGQYHDFTSGKVVSLNTETELSMLPWEFKVYVK